MSYNICNHLARGWKNIPDGTIPGKIPNITQKKINIIFGQGTKKSPGIERTWIKHGNNPSRTNKSQFEISKEEVIKILQDTKTVKSPVGICPKSKNFIREVDVGKTIGRLPQDRGGKLTSKITVIVDSQGNLVNVYPGTFKY